LWSPIERPANQAKLTRSHLTTRTPSRRWTHRLRVFIDWLLLEGFPARVGRGAG
jgi:hypothetical protein